MKRGMANIPFHGLLVSSGFSSSILYDRTLSIVHERTYTRAHIVTTAHPKKENSHWNIITKKQLEEMGLSVSFVDFDAGESLDASVDLVYVCGGNTFHLLHSIQQASAPLRQQFIDLSSRGGLYVGSSAGAVLVSPSIAVAGEIHPDKNNDHIVDFIGFNFISQYIVPHYVPSLDPEITLFCTRNNLSNTAIITLQDGEGFFVEHGKGEKIHI